jgi:hypothetical protein
MSTHHARHKIAWLSIGVLAGICVSYLWQHEPAFAISNDRDPGNFAILTSPVSFGQTAQGIFTLDFLTGQLKGAVMNNKTAKFTNFYQRNIAEDFGVDPAAEPHYAIVAGSANLPSQGPNTTAQAVIYVAELSSGQCIAYAFEYRESIRPLPPFELAPVDRFQWREAM